MNKKNNVTFAVEDATCLSFQDNSVDAILVANALHIMPEPEKVLAEALRVLKNNGLLIAPTFIYDANVPKFRMWFLSKLGFKTFNKWSDQEYLQFVERHHFKTLLMKVIKVKPLSECLLISIKNDI